MALVLLFTILGFLTGLAYVLVKRKIKPGKLLAATFSGLLAAGAFKIFKDYSRKKRRY
ncbi:MAG: hypothetical protein PHN57_01315 [Candidatus Omnitrophica bacterium]|nr:hypothetical protein [Candidatus Omnitrophota bacterium]